MGIETALISEKLKSEVKSIMTQQDKEKVLDDLYNSLQAYKHKHNMNILYEIIHVKSAFCMLDHRQSLYLDVKKFIQSYVFSVAKEDYGYDCILVSKIEEAASHLSDLKMRKSVLQVARRIFSINGYETDDLTSAISKIDLKIALSNHRYLKALCLFLGSNLWTLLFTYLFYILVVGLMLLPAPFEWMSMFNVELKEYSCYPVCNHIINTLALITGNDALSPFLEPKGILGMIVYCLGIVLFYFFFVNFIFKRIEDYISIK